MYDMKKVRLLGMRAVLFCGMYDSLLLEKIQRLLGSKGVAGLLGILCEFQRG